MRSRVVLVVDLEPTECEGNKWSGKIEAHSRVIEQRKPEEEILRTTEIREIQKLKAVYIGEV